VGGCESLDLFVLLLGVGLVGRKGYGRVEGEEWKPQGFTVRRIIGDEMRKSE
jgi:hypothetical protein